MLYLTPDMKTIEEIFEALIAQHRSFDIAEYEFRKLLYEDQEFHSRYREWCHEQGYREKNGFTDYCRQYIDEQDEKLNVLSDDDSLL